VEVEAYIVAYIYIYICIYIYILLARQLFLECEEIYIGYSVPASGGTPSSTLTAAGAATLPFWMFTGAGCAGARDFVRTQFMISPEEGGGGFKDKSERERERELY
jgi:hypothetical protein